MLDYGLRGSTDQVEALVESARVVLNPYIFQPYWTILLSSLQKGIKLRPLPVYERVLFSPCRTVSW